MARIEFSENPDTPEAFRGGWVEIADYMTLAMRQRIDNAGMALELDAVKIRDLFSQLGEGAAISDLTPGQLADAANLRLDLGASEFADLREVVTAYSIIGEAPRRGGATFPDELPEALEWVVERIRAHYGRQRRTPAARKSVGASV